MSVSGKGRDGKERERKGNERKGGEGRMEGMKEIKMSVVILLPQVVPKDY